MTEPAAPPSRVSPGPPSVPTLPAVAPGGVPRRADGSTDYPALLRQVAAHEDLRAVPEAQAGLRRAADEMQGYEEAREFFGTSAAHVKVRLHGLGVDYCPAVLDDKACENDDCTAWEHWSIGKVVEVVMRALHAEVLEVRRVHPWSLAEWGTSWAPFAAGSDRLKPVAFPRPSGNSEESPFIDLPSGLLSDPSPSPFPPLGGPVKP